LENPRSRVRKEVILGNTTLIGLHYEPERRSGALNGAQIKDIRMELQMTQQELGDQLGLHISTISRYELNKIEPPESFWYSLKYLKEHIKKTAQSIAV
jgi:DNA-binding transcriptional regulator YiaG